MSEHIFEMENISKVFPGVHALDLVNFRVAKGEIHALVGENGAGKSTLMKILSGLYPYGSYTGRIIIKGTERQFQSIKDSEKAGVVVIYQELALVKQLSITENIFLGSEVARGGVIDWDRALVEARKWLDEVGLTLVKARRSIDRIVLDAPLAPEKTAAPSTPTDKPAPATEKPVQTAPAPAQKP